MNHTLVVPNHFQQISKCRISLEAYFSGIRSNLLIMVDESSHQIRLSFGDRPTGKNFNPIKTLLCHEVCTRLKPFHKTEFTIGFGQLCDLKAVAWSVAIAYRELGYQCKIQCGAEAIEVDALVANTALPQRMQNLQEVASCA